MLLSEEKNNYATQQIDVVILLLIRKLSISYRTYKKENQITESIWSETLGVYLIRKIVGKYKKSK